MTESERMVISVSMEKSPSIDRHSKESLSSQLKNILISQIRNGTLKAGEKIPSERELSEQYAVSRATTRNTVMALAHEGYVVRYSGSGTFIKDRTDVSKKHQVETGNIAFIRCQHSSSSHTIKQDHIYFDILEGIQSHLANGEFHLIFSYIFEIENSFETSLTALAKKADGLIIGEMRNQHSYNALQQLNVPVVLVTPSIHYNGLDTVDYENVFGAIAATEHLIRLGHRKIGFINGRLTTRHAAEKLAGYKKALEKNEIAFNEKYVTGGTDWQSETGYRSMKKLLLDRAGISAVFTANDAIAFGAMNAIHDMDLRIPEDIAVIGFDDMITSAHVTPPLTTMKIDRHDMGRNAARRLFDIMRPGSTSHQKILFTPELVIRASCGAKKQEEAS